LIFLNIAPPLLRQAGVMTRPALEQHDLIALLNWELAAYDECDGCRFTSIRSLRVDEQLIMRRLIEDTRRQYDLRAH
jgi:hypothetical protein